MYATLGTLWASAAYWVSIPGMRAGQALYNAVGTHHARAVRDLGEGVVGTSFDPFSDDANIDRFLAYLRYQLGEFDASITAEEMSRAS